MVFVGGDGDGDGDFSLNVPLLIKTHVNTHADYIPPPHRTMWADGVDNDNDERRRYCVTRMPSRMPTDGAMATASHWPHGHGWDQGQGLPPSQKAITDQRRTKTHRHERTQHTHTRARTNTSYSPNLVPNTHTVELTPKLTPKRPKSQPLWALRRENVYCALTSTGEHIRVYRNQNQIQCVNIRGDARFLGPSWVLFTLTTLAHPA